jgi:hypothetical protein
MGMRLFQQGAKPDRLLFQSINQCYICYFVFVALFLLHHSFNQHSLRTQQPKRGRVALLASDASG